MNRQKISSGKILSGVMLFFLLFLHSFAEAATITVQSFSDGAVNAANCPGPGCRLRDAIAAAGVGDTIDFNLPTYPAVISLTSGELLIDKNLTISGPGAANLTISGNNASRVFNITGTTVTIKDLTISGGRATSINAYGGGMYINNVSPTLTNITFSGNKATSNANNSAHGGGIYINGGSPTLTNITFSENRATGGNLGNGFGGGIYINSGDPTLTDITFSGNAATGGTSVQVSPAGSGYGGGIYNNGGSPTLTNITFSGNSATDGPGTGGSGFGGGMYISSGNPTITNSIFRGDTASTSDSEIYGSATVTYSVIAGGCPASSTCSNLISTDPLLGPLADNGGPTKTMALLTGSSAINTGTNAGCPATDQRGITRLQGGICDIGAYEFVPDTTTTLTSSVTPSVFGQAVTFTATVSDSETASTPTGMVTFKDGGTDITGCVDVALTGVSASCTSSELAIGSRQITAEYTSSNGFDASTGGSLDQVVNQASTTTTVSSVPNPSVFGQSYAVNFTVSPVAPGAGSPTGNVTVSDGVNSCNATVAVGTCSLPSTSVGPFTLTAAYAGDTNFNGSSGTVGQTVNKANSTTTAALTSGADPSTFGQSVTFTATVTNGATGTVTFSEGATTYCSTVSISGGQAACSISSLSAGSHTITAIYNGNANYNGSSGTVVQTVNKAAPTITFDAAPTPTYLGGNFIVSASTTNTDSGTLTYSYVSGLCAFVSGATFSSSGAGTCVVQSNGVASANFNAASQTQNITIGKAGQAITFGALSDKATDSPSFGVTASSDSDLAVSFSSLTTSVCTVTGGTVTLTHTLGTCTIEATQAGDGNYNAATPVDRSFNVTTGAMDHIVITPSGSTITAGSSQSYTVEGFDAVGNSLGDVTGATTFSITPDGSCTANSCTATISGPHTVTADDGGVTTSATLTVEPGPAVAFSVSSPSSAIAGDAIDVTVEAKDTYNNTVPGYTGVISFTSTDTQAILPSDYTFIAGDNGTKTFTGGVILKTAGPMTVTATDTVTSSITGTSGSIDVVAASVTRLKVTAPAVATAGNAIDVIVTAQDTYNNTVTGFTGTVHFTSLDTQAVLPSDYTFIAGDNGSKTFNNGVTLKTAGTMTVTATDTVNSLITGTSGSIAVSEGALNHFAISTIGSPQTALNAFSVTITAQDLYNNTVTGFTGTVDLSITAGSSVSPLTTGSFVAGVWTGDVTVSGAGSGITITATRTGGAETASSNAFDVQKIDQTITVTTHAPAAATYNTGFDVVATGGASGQPVVYGSSGVCSNSGAAFTMTGGTGICTVHYNQAGDENYNAASEVAEDTTAQKAAQTITFGAAPTPTYLGGNFIVSASTTNTDSGTLTYSYVSGPCAFVSGATFSSSGAGTCVVQSNGVASANFNAATQTQSITIGKAGQAIIFGALSDKTTDSPSFGITASADSGLTVGFSSLTTSVCTVTGNTVTLTHTLGTCTIRASQSGDSNYNAATPVDRSFNVTAGAPLNNTVTIPSATGKGPITLTTNSPGCGFYNVQAFTEGQVAVADPVHNYPYGLVAFSLSCAAADVTITFPGNISQSEYYKYGPTTPGDPATAKWYDFTNITANGANSITLHLQDDRLGDDTGLDGVIVDQGGPGMVNASGVIAVPTMNEWGMIAFIMFAGLASVYRMRRKT